MTPVIATYSPHSRNYDDIKFLNYPNYNGKFLKCLEQKDGSFMCGTVYKENEGNRDVDPQFFVQYFGNILLGSFILIIIFLMIAKIKGEL